MTDKEREELCDALRHVHPCKSLSVMAAEEIERLAADNGDMRISGMMTDEERQKLCNTLRSQNWFYPPASDKAKQAADEIERLAKEVARLKDENGVIREQCQNMLDMMVR